jgi:hypothetical protein
VCLKHLGALLTEQLCRAKGHKPEELGKTFAVVEAIKGEFHSGFESQQAAELYVSHKQNEYDIDDEYAFRVVKVLSEINQLEEQEDGEV